LIVGEDRATRAMLAALCVLAIVPWIFAMAAQLAVIELRAGCRSCSAGLRWLMVQAPWK